MLSGRGGQGSDAVVRFVARHPEHGHTEGSHKILDDGQLKGEVLGHLHPLGVVVLVGVDTLGRNALIEGDRYVGRFLGAKQAQYHIHKTGHCIYRDTR